MAMMDITMTTEDTTITITGIDTLVCNGAGLGTNKPVEGVDDRVDEEAVGTGERRLGASVVFAGRLSHLNAVGHFVSLQNPSKSLFSVATSVPPSQ